MADETEKKQVKLNLFDRVINSISPIRGLSRIRAKLVLKSLENSGYVSGSSSRKSLRSWNPDSSSSDVDDLESLDVIRGRSRDGYRNIPLARGALRRMKTSAMATGLLLQCRIKRDLLKIDDDSADAWERDTENRFNAWASSKSADLTYYTNFYEGQVLSFLSFLMSGDCFILLPRKNRPELDNDLRFKIIEADFCCNENGSMDTEELAGGVKVDTDGAPIEYQFSTRHPGSNIISGRKWVKVKPRSTSGRRQLLHLFELERPGQRRGVPVLAPVMEALKQLGRYAESELMAAVVQSFFTAFIKQQIKTEDPLAPSVPDSQKITDKENNPNDQHTYEMGTGNIVGMGENEDVTFADPKRPSSAFDPFFQSICRMIGSCLEIPFELLILHFTASYSAARAALLEAWKLFRNQRNFMATNFCQPIFEEWLYWEVFEGRIKAPGFLTDNLARYAWCSTSWQGSAQGQIDPIKETKAAVMKIENNLSDWETEFQKSEAGDWEATMKRKARQTQFIKDNKIDKPVATPDGGDGGGDDSPAQPEE